MDALSAVVKAQVVFNQAQSIVGYAVAGRSLFIVKIVDNNSVTIRWATELSVVDKIVILVRRVVSNDDAILPIIRTSVLRLVDGDAAVLVRGLKNAFP